MSALGGPSVEAAPSGQTPATPGLATAPLHMDVSPVPRAAAPPPPAPAVDPQAAAAQTATDA